MQQPFILQHLFQASSLDEIPRERLESFVAEYPSFGIGHYLLSRKLKAEGADQFAAETQRTGLYFPNPFWLQWQLEHASLAGGRSEWVTAVASVPVWEPAVTAAEPEVAVEEPAVEVAVEEPVVAVSESHPVAAEETVITPEEPAYTPNVVTVAEESFDLPSGDDLAEAMSSSMSAESSAADELLKRVEEAKKVRSTLQKINDNFEGDAAIAGEAVPAEAAEPIPELGPVAIAEEPVTAAEQPVVAGEDPIHDQEAPFVLDESAQLRPEPETEPIQDEEPPFVLEDIPPPVTAAEPEPIAATSEPLVIAAEPEAANAPIIPTLSGQSAEKDLVFEPYHTIDYFASQGIKFSLDENPKDQLGKQLKSFTDWLKGMRRLPSKDRVVVPDRVAEEAVQSIAAHSIEGKDILTETMAEVLIKQGMRERARAVYEKLSLLNPEKRAYFAAKIEQLNIP